jgi:hypothetical protein
MEVCISLSHEVVTRLLARGGAKGFFDSITGLSLKVLQLTKEKYKYLPICE